MACYLLSAKALPEPILTYCQLDTQEQSSVISQSKYKFFIEEKAFENAVCKIAAILLRRVNLIFLGLLWLMIHQHRKG